MGLWLIRLTLPVGVHALAWVFISGETANMPTTPDTKNKLDKIFLTKYEAAFLTGRSIMSIKECCRYGKIKYTTAHLGTSRHILIPASELEKLNALPRHSKSHEHL